MSAPDPARYPKLPTAPRPPGPPTRPAEDRSPGSSYDRRRRETIRAATVTGIAILVAASSVLVFVTYFGPSNPAIDVIAIYFTSSDNACGASSLNWSGYTTGSGDSYGLWLPVVNPSYSVNCTIESVGAVTPGFSVSGPTDLPLRVPAGGIERLGLVVNSPNGTFQGNLTLDAE